MTDAHFDRATGRQGQVVSDKQPQRPPRPQRHGPMEVYGGAPPARSALTLRLVLASIGLVLCIIGAIWGVLNRVPVALVVLFCVVAVISVVDLIVIVRRKRRGDPG